MSERGAKMADTGAAQGDRRGTSRTPRSIRFAEAEWQRIEVAAQERGILAAEYVRFAALDLAAGKPGTAPVAVSAALATLTEATYRGVYLLATVKRDEMVREGRRDEIDRTLDDARKSQLELTSGD